MIKALKIIGIVLTVAAVVAGAYLICRKVIEYMGGDDECEC
jgi:hypothetical protein